MRPAAIPIWWRSRTARSLGYAYAGPYRARPAYRWTVEDSVYVDAGAHRRGLGRALLARLIGESEARGFRQMIAVIGDSANVSSIELHRALGFRMVGTFDNVGFKFGRWLDSVLMQRPLGPGATAPAEPIGADQQSISPPTTLERLVDRASTRSSSWPRRTISPVAEITL